MKRLLQLLLPLYLTVVLLIVLEFILSLYYNNRPDDYISNPYRLAKPVGDYNSPFIYMHQYRPEDPYKRNNLGFRRDSDSKIDRTNGTKRILSYGDSVGLGYQVRTEETYSSVAERELQQLLQQPVEVFNMARGNSPSIYAMNMKVDVPTLKPDAIVVQIELLNDTSDEAHIDYAGLDSDGLPTNITRARYWPEWLTMPPISPKQRMWEKLYLRKLLFDINRKIQVSLQQYVPNPVFSQSNDMYYYNLGFDQYYLTQQRLDTGFVRMFETIQSMHAYAKKRNISFLLVVLPSIHVFDNSQFSPGAIRIYDAAIDQAIERSIPFVGLKDIFAVGGGASLFFDFVHPTQTGYELMGKIIAEKML